MKPLIYIGIGIAIGIVAVNLFKPEEKYIQSHNPPEGIVPTIDSIDNKSYTWDKSILPHAGTTYNEEKKSHGSSEKPVEVYEGYYVEDYIIPLIRNSGLSKKDQNEEIQQAYERWGKKRKYYSIPNRRFTDEEIRWLRKHYPDYIFKTVDHNIYSEKETFEQQIEDYNNSHH